MRNREKRRSVGIVGLRLLVRVSEIVAVGYVMGYLMPEAGFISALYGYAYTVALAVGMIFGPWSSKPAELESNLPLALQGVMVGCLAGLSVIEAGEHGVSMVMVGWLIVPPLAVYRDFFRWMWRQVVGGWIRREGIRQLVGRVIGPPWRL